MGFVVRRLVLGLAATTAVAAGQAPPSHVEVLTAAGSLPAHLAGRFREPVQFVQLDRGDYLILDRRAHTVSRIDAAMANVTQVIDIGLEAGRVLAPTALSVGPSDVIAVADAPSSHERIQYFSGGGQALGGFFLDARVAPRLTVGPLVLNGVGSMQFTGDAFLINRPESGALITLLNMQGHAVRHIGLLRPTGHEADAQLHLALNSGLPLIDPAGGFYFVFQAGVPMFRKYDEEGRLVFERHIEGVELDRRIQSLPTTWPERETETGVYPLVTPLVRTAAVDTRGRLWVALTMPFTYVYDRRGDKVRTVQFRAAGAVTPTSLFFTRDDRVLVTPGCFVFEVPEAWDSEPRAAQPGVGSGPAGNPLGLDVR
jgi:hypothetical protein